jgi:hypothetical protein
MINREPGDPRGEVTAVGQRRLHVGDWVWVSVLHPVTSAFSRVPGT